MKQKIKLLAVVSASTLGACSGIGDGNAPVSLEIRVAGNAESGELFECLATTAQAVLSFDDGRQGDFARRVSWSSSDETILKVSDGTEPTGNGQFFVNGALLPRAAGTVTVTASYLTFEDSIDVTVSPVEIELGPQGQVLAQGNRLLMNATAILDGQSRLTTTDMTSLGLWSIDGADEAASEIQADNGLLSARSGAEAVDTVRYTIDFCDRSETVSVEIVNQTLSALELVLASDTEIVPDSIALPPDASLGLRALGRYSGGLTQNLTSAVTYTLSDAEVAFAGLRGPGLVTSFDDAAGRSAQLSASFDPSSTVEGDEILSNVVAVEVLDVALQPESLAIAPQGALMLHSSQLPMRAAGRFSGNDGELDWDLTNDVIWSSDNTALLGIGNQSGSRGFAFAAASGQGPVVVSAVRSGTDGPETAPSSTVLVASDSDEGEPFVIGDLQLESDQVAGESGDQITLRAIAMIGNDNVQGSQDISTLAVWSSSDPSVALVSNAPGSRGLVRLVGEGTDQSVTISARFFDSNLQDERFEASLQLVVNPSPDQEPGESTP